MGVREEEFVCLPSTNQQSQNDIQFSLRVRNQIKTKTNSLLSRQSIQGVKKDQVRRGMCACQPGSARAVDNCETKIYMLKKEEGGSNVSEKEEWAEL
jgi:translation elongation factor EF-Tu-like GTPase